MKNKFVIFILVNINYVFILILLASLSFDLGPKLKSYLRTGWLDTRMLNCIELWTRWNMKFINILAQVISIFTSWFYFILFYYEKYFYLLINKHTWTLKHIGLKMFLYFPLFNFGQGDPIWCRHHWSTFHTLFGSS